MRSAAIVLALALTTTASSALAAERYMHLHIDDHSAHKKTVRLDLPMYLVETGFSLLSLGDNMHIRIGDGEVRGNELRQILASVRSAHGPIAVGHRSQTLAWRDGAALVLETREHGRVATVRIPFELATALTRGSGDEMNMRAAIDVLSRRGGELLMVDADDAKVQIWVDNSSISR